LCGMGRYGLLWRSYGQLFSQQLRERSAVVAFVLTCACMQRAGQSLVATRKSSKLSSARSSKSTMVCVCLCLFVCTFHTSVCCVAACEAVDVLVASPDDQKSVDAVVAQTRVLIAC